ncbi:amidohydrolase family protein [Robiginitomaculum antarcticum]|uniref:amidohydrolase family protein n=1 Tax=Robiginitomaculum antarcticum TaxID=437507 RepID=UPI000376D95D|nr:amidohydrolase family protein [Robiginitomaculum antarcticum]
MQKNTIMTWGLRAAAVIVGLVALAALALTVYINSVWDPVFGSQTELADHAQFATDMEPIAITHVSVLSPDGKEMLADQTVLLDDGEIISVANDGPVPKGMTVIDGQGKYLIPGLTDSHAHLHRSPNDLLLYVANGVTQIRSMNGSSADLVLREEIKNGRIGPHYYVSSPSMNSDEGWGPVKGALPIPSWMPERLHIWFIETAFNHESTATTEQAVREAREFIERGYDGLKLYGFLTMDSFRAILDVAEEFDIPTAGHLPDAFPLSELRTTKLNEIGHLEEIYKALQREFAGSESEGRDTFLAFVDSRKEEIIGDLLANDIAVHSTLWYTESLNEQIFDLDSKIVEVQLGYANPGIVKGHPSSGTSWLPGFNKFQTYAGNTPEEIARNKEFWDVREKAHYILLKAMVDGGVTILAGTDSNGWLVVPGFSLHDELQSLNLVGMSPAQTLYSATAAPARLINNNAGVIEAGRRADLVLLNEDPLANIENTKSIDTVILNGRVLDRSKLNAMLEAVAEANASSRNFDISLYQ